MLRIGLTGGIGSGKSAASRILGILGAGLIDADLVGHASYRSGTEGFEKVTKAFGNDLIGDDGEIDRKKLGPIVFSEPDNLNKLNAILHPIIYSMIKTELTNMENSEKNIPFTFKKALITGITGSGGSYLAEHIVQHHPNVKLHGIARWHSTTAHHNLSAIQDSITVHECDLLDYSSVLKVLQDVGIESQLRPQNLNTEDWIKIFYPTRKFIKINER